jgi:ABC-type nitrate/sulfonate/bicarbonate transport system substrate-binding protein
LKAIRLVVFPGTFNWPVWVAQKKGWFADEGVEVAVTPTPGSVFQLSGLIEGTFDLAITLVDNVVAYRSGQGEVPVLGEDLVALMACDTRVFPSLVTLPEVRSYADLRGRTLSVDAKTTGYAMVLHAMLEHRGLGRDEYAIESVGGALQRFEGLLARRQAGALFNSPFESLLVAKGFNLLDTAISVLGSYQGQVVAARQRWAAGNAMAVCGFVRALLRAIAWLYEADNRAEAFAIHDENNPGAAPGSAAVAHDSLFHPLLGFPRSGEIDLQGLAKVLELRSRFGVPRKALGAPADYYRPEYLVKSRLKSPFSPVRRKD